MEPIQTVLMTSPNGPYLETIETVLDLYSDKGRFPSLLDGTHKKELAENCRVSIVKLYTKLYSDSD